MITCFCFAPQLFPKEFFSFVCSFCSSYLILSINHKKIFCSLPVLWGSQAPSPGKVEKTSQFLLLPSPSLIPPPRSLSLNPWDGNACSGYKPILPLLPFYSRSVHHRSPTSMVYLSAAVCTITGDDVFCACIIQPVRNACALKPKITEWIAPMRAQPSTAYTSSGTMPIYIIPGRAFFTPLFLNICATWQTLFMQTVIRARFLPGHPAHLVPRWWRLFPIVGRCRSIQFQWCSV